MSRAASLACARSSAQAPLPSSARAGRSGALLPARIAGSLGRTVAAVPGHVTAPLAAGPNQLLAGGAHLVADAQDALDLMFGAGVRTTAGETRPALEPQLSNLLSAL